MWRFHTQELGWSDIAQHVSIAPDGTIWSGRDWNKTPVSSRGFNHAGVFMFEMIGDFDTGKDKLEGAQLRSALMATAAIQDQFGLPLWSSVKFHNQMSGKTCPGSAVDRVDYIRQLRDVRRELENAPILSGAAFADTEMTRLTESEAEIGHDTRLESYWDAQEKRLGSLAPPPTGVETATAAVALTWKGHAADTGYLAYQALERVGDDEEALLEELGALTAMPGDLAMEGFADDVLKRAGRRILRRLERELHALMCGSNGDDDDDRRAIRDALGISEDAAVGAVTAFLVGGLGLAPVVAGVVGALILKRLLRPAIEAGVEELCGVWSERIEGLD